MRKISDYLSKPLISLTNASFEGTVIGFLCGKKLKTIEYLCLLIENDTIDEFRYISLRYIRNYTENAVTVTNNRNIKRSEEVDLSRYIHNPINSTVYISNGKLVGKINDLLFNDTGKQVVSVLVDDKTIPINQVATVSRDIVILYNENQKPVRKNSPRIVKKPEQDIPVSLPIETDDYDFEHINENFVSDNTEIIESLHTEKSKEQINNDSDKKEKPKFEQITLSENNAETENVNRELKNDKITEKDKPEKKIKKSKQPKKIKPKTTEVKPINLEKAIQSEQTVNTETAEESKQISEEDKMPTKLISDYKFLLGRVVTNDIYNMRRELIIKKGSVITADIVDIARKYGKLIELTLSSKS